MAACIFLIETSSKVCSLAVVENGKPVFERTDGGQSSHSAVSGVFAQEALRFLAGKKPDAIAVSEGPGSYTGLRIGVSLAKGLCYGLDVPLIAVPTLKIIANSAVLNLQLSGIALNPSDILIPMIDARRMEVYTAVYASDLTEIEAAKPVIVDEQSFSNLPAGKKLFFGDGSDKCKTVIDLPDARFIEGVNPSAIAMAALAEEQFAAGDFVDVAYFEPFYLKEFQATSPKNKVFNS
ncbi:MAG: tRNA (adenosine(37)-N6)-threonylcarbamoyltransferase complex dimerization subunit type 1 TsaB [Dysgonamonadaceae bacterium]|jgi:tRNA threonylcarbamoyladenosine biosynthesis protein TsaB|nr:tRNA (adenosine(37)-N6)-threonylcarbamoyltransferase complex dimerization subunit type 1 TsaB [Dysgonamonadaceae bacterium]